MSDEIGDDILRAALSGDPEARRCVRQWYAPALEALIRASARGGGDVSHFVDAAFEEAWMVGHQFVTSNGMHFSSWLSQITSGILSKPGSSARTSSSWDDDLVRHAQAGDKRAMRLLIERYWDRVMSIAFRRGVPEADREDVTQVILTKVAKALQSYVIGGRASFRTWLSAIAHHCITDYKRGAYRRPREHPLTVEPGDPPPRTPLALALKQAVETLPVELAHVFIAYFIEEQTLREIAEACDSSTSTVDRQLRRACELLRPKLAPYFDKDGRQSRSKGKS